MAAVILGIGLKFDSRAEKDQNDRSEDKLSFHIRFQLRRSVRRSTLEF